MDCANALIFIFRYQIMLSCWQEDPDNRPTFEILGRKLKEMENQHKVWATLSKKKAQFKEKRNLDLLP